MAMSTGGSSGRAPLSEINVTPLVDVMLVLLIIFMVAAPLLTHAVNVDLPKAASAPSNTKSDTVTLSIDADGHLFWNGKSVDEAGFAADLQAAADQRPTPELHIRAERMTPYERVAQVMSEAARHGLTRIGFITDPTPVR